MIITREIINKNIKFHDICFEDDGITDKVSYDYDFLSKCIDLYKTFLLDNGVKYQDTVAILEFIKVWQIAAIFACLELGVKIAIYDFINGKLVETGLDCDSKTKALLPINYIVIPKAYHNEKLKYCAKFADKLLFRTFKNNDILTSNKNELILATEDSIAVKSTTSGTTANPKLVEHTHRFLHSLALRNASQFYGVYATIRNLNHGSSIFSYFVPAIASNKVVEMYNFMFAPYFSEGLHLYKIQELCELDHVMLPYPELISKWLKKIKQDNLTGFKKTNIHTLSYIQEEWVNEFYKTGLIGDIISNFGSNETTGPIFSNKASNDDFSEKSYSLVDDFFKVEIVDKNINVTLPIYDKTVTMNDYFEVENGKYIHIGRSDWIRINDFQVYEFVYKDIVDQVLNGELIYDQIKSQIYLSIWESIVEDIDEKIFKINEQLKKYSDDRHYISKYGYLNHSDFINGIKLDKEMIREYFRNPDGDYQRLN